MRPNRRVALWLLALAAGLPLWAGEEAAPDKGALDKPRIILLPEFDLDQAGPDQPTAVVPRPLPSMPPRRLEGVPSKEYLLVGTLLTKAFLAKRYDLVDPKVAGDIARVFTRLREFRDPSAASGTVDSVAQQVAYGYNADLIVFYKLLVHEVKPDADVPKVKTVHDSVQARVVVGSTGRLFAMEERDAKGISETDAYLAHRMAIERVLGKPGEADDPGLANALVKQIEAWWADYAKKGRPVVVNFFIQGEDATRLQQLAALLKSEGSVTISGQPRPRRVINSEQTKEIFAEYEIGLLGALFDLQAMLVKNAAELKLADGMKLADKFRITVDAFGDHVTLCLLDPARPEVRPGVGIVVGNWREGHLAANDRQTLAAVARKATVMVRSYTKKGDALAPVGHGSGPVVTADGLVVTNFHVVNNAQKYFVEFEAEAPAAGNPQFEAELVRSMPDRDLALLKIKLLRPEDARFTALPLGKSLELRVGDEVVAVGAPFNSELINNVTFGTVSALGRGPNKYIVHTAPMYRGSSGGPLLNLRGEIVGINTAMPTGAVIAAEAGQPKEIGRVPVSGFGYAIPVELVQELLK
ncbi:MAG: trypsin-like serine protease [Planctomycetes bacterium]|nr:trypsin-like serine protease [Planctomycetota bacterium]